MQTVATFLLRLLFLTAALVFAASLAFAFVVMLAVWGVRAAWARLTGKPVVPFIVRIDPRGGFQRMYRRSQRSRAAGTDASRRAATADAATDVEYRERGI